MYQSCKYVIPVFALTFGLAGTLHAAGDASQMQRSSQGGGHQSDQLEATDEEEMAIIKGSVQKVDGEIYTIRDEQGQEMQLRIEKDVLQGDPPKKGDIIEANVLMGSIMYNVFSAKKAGQGGSIQSQTQSQGQGGK